MVVTSGTATAGAAHLLGVEWSLLADLAVALVTRGGHEPFATSASKGARHAGGWPVLLAVLIAYVVGSALGAGLLGAGRASLFVPAAIVTALCGVAWLRPWS